MTGGKESSGASSNWAIDAFLAFTVESQHCRCGRSSVNFDPSQARTVQKLALLFLLLSLCAQAALAVSNFAPQRRVGHTIGDQWEPAIAADAHGYVYILYPQYGAAPDCGTCTAPTVALQISNDN